MPCLPLQAGSSPRRGPCLHSDLPPQITRPPAPAPALGLYSVGAQQAFLNCLKQDAVAFRSSTWPCFPDFLSYPSTPQPIGRQNLAAWKTFHFALPSHESTMAKRLLKAAGKPRATSASLPAGASQPPTTVPCPAARPRVQTVP